MTKKEDSTEAAAQEALQADADAREAKTAEVDESAQPLVEQEAKAQEKGYRGVVTDPIPNEAYSLKSGPDSPSVPATRIVQPVLPDEVNH